MNLRGLFGVFSIIIFLIIEVPAELYHPNDNDLKKIELRGEVATGDFTWDPQNFAGFYYDLDNNIGTEQIATTFTEGNKLQEQQGIIYSTSAQKIAFEYEPWGYFNIIGFLGKPYFAGYILNENMPGDDQVLDQKSVDKCSLCDGQLQEILIDNNNKAVLTLDTPLTLAQGYKLNIKSIDYDADEIYIELTKDGTVVDSTAINTSKNWASIAD
ncbi:MAG: S-layer protein, partial [Methanotrichaceae archaeon]|nr:S-layer protein [Methanotrichaceae archaeon]